MEWLLVLSLESSPLIDDNCTIAYRLDIDYRASQRDSHKVLGLGTRACQYLLIPDQTWANNEPNLHFSIFNAIMIMKFIVSTVYPSRQNFLVTEKLLRCFHLLLFVPVQNSLHGWNSRLHVSMFCYNP